MFSEAKHDPTGRFAGLAKTYAGHRPSYPRAAIECITAKIGERALPIADVGAGTGILSRQLAEAGFSVIGVEPNESMRSEAIAAGPTSIQYLAGRAEATGLPDASVAAVVVGQAFHWCDPDPSLWEFHRILAPGGWATLIWNQFDLSDGGTAEFRRLLNQASPDRDIVSRPHHESGAALLGHPAFIAGHAWTFAHGQDLTEEGLLGRAFSISYAPKECGASQRFADSLRELFHRRSSNGSFRMAYRVIVYQALRSDRGTN